MISGRCIKDGKRQFNYRACVVILNDNKILAMTDENAPYYYLVGGKAELHETAENDVLREIKEEMNIDAETVRFGFAKIFLPKR